MRRPLLVVCIIVIISSFIFTKYESSRIIGFKERNIEVSGVITKKVSKEKYIDYVIENKLIRTYNKSLNLTMGEKVKIKGKVQDIKKESNNDFNYYNYIRGMGYDSLIYLENYEKIGENKLLKNINDMKEYISSTSKYLYKENSHIINSLIIGEKEYLSTEEKELFSKTGTSHVVSISGLHISIISSILILMIGNIYNLKKLTVLLCIMFCYTIMVGSSPSIIRALFFIVISYIAKFIDCKKDLISILSLVATILILNNPYIIYNISFQLSFLATLSIIYFYGYLNKLIKIDIISITISANILTIPIIYYNFNNISLNSIISNMVIVPFIGVIIVISIISILAFKVNIDLSYLFASINNLLIDIIYYLLEVISKIDFLYLEFESPKKIIVIMYYAIIFIYMVYKEIKVMKEQENELQGYHKEYTK